MYVIFILFTQLTKMLSPFGVNLQSKPNLKGCHCILSFSIFLMDFKFQPHPILSFGLNRKEWHSLWKFSLGKSFEEVG